MRRSRLLIAWGSVVCALGAIVAIELTGVFDRTVPVDSHGHVIRQSQPLIPIPPRDIKVIEIAYQNGIYRFERDHHGDWFHHQHDHHADSGHGHEHGHTHEDSHGESQGDSHGDSHGHSHASEEAHSSGDAHHDHADDLSEKLEQTFLALSRARIERQLESNLNLGQYGVMKPPMVINVYGADVLRPEVRLAVGDVAPDTYSRYIMAIGSFAIVTIPDYQIENLVSMLKSL